MNTSKAGRVVNNRLSTGNVDMHAFDLSLCKLGLLRSINTTNSGTYQSHHDVVQEVMEGEETPMIERSRKETSKLEDRNKHYASLAKKVAQPLFPYPEGSATYETI